ncbi:MAG: DUF3352 domain-containing protein [Planctomycetota bacterium]
MTVRTVAALLMTLVLVSTSPAQSDRPSAMRLLPAETVLMVRTADAGLLVERLQGSLSGQMLRDPSMADLTERAWGKATEAYEANVRGLLELDLEDLLRLPQGEVAFAMINRPYGPPGLVLLADFSEQPRVALQLAEKLENLAAENADLTVTEQQLRSDTATVVRDGNNTSRSVAFVERDGVFLVANDVIILQRTLDRWDGLPIEELVVGDGSQPESEETAAEDAEIAQLYLQSLAENPSFAATMKEVLPGAEEPPQLLFFIDPIGMVEAVGGRNTGVRVAMATFPALGLNGIKGFGFGGWVNTEQWDSLLQGHLLLEAPRAGVVKIARLETGVVEPPPYVPAGVENFGSFRVDSQRLFDDIATTYDRFQYAGAFRKLVDARPTKALGINFEKEFVGNASGNGFWITSYDGEGRLPQGQTSLGVGVLDAAAAQESLDKVAEKYPSILEPATLGAVNYYRFVPRPFRDMPPEERPFSPCVAILDDTLVSCQSFEQFEQFVQASDGTRERLVDSLQYRLVKSRLSRLTEGRPFSAMHYSDVAPMIKHFLARASNDEARQWREERSDRNAFFAGVNELLDGAELPSEEALLKYCSPSGSVIIDTPTGWRLIGFSFKGGQ